jgi:hypothetical protein
MVCAVYVPREYLILYRGHIQYIHLLRFVDQRTAPSEVSCFLRRKSVHVLQWEIRLFLLIKNI